MNEELKAKLAEILKRLDSQSKSLIDSKYFEKLEHKLILNNTEAANILGVCPRSMYNLRKFHGLSYHLVRKRPMHTWQHIHDYLKSIADA